MLRIDLIRQRTDIHLPNSRPERVDPCGIDVNRLTLDRSHRGHLALLVIVFLHGRARRSLSYRETGAWVPGDRPRLTIDVETVLYFRTLEILLSNVLVTNFMRNAR